jgi:cytochrome oxidase Cu insertion factor (SCO1/SenC/PrrC family)
MFRLRRCVYSRWVACSWILLSCVSCSRSTRDEASLAKDPQPAKMAIEEGPADSNDLRVLFKAPDFKLTDQLGEAYDSRELVGRVWVVNFIFTNCASTCPLQSSRLEELQARIATWPHGNRVRLLSITVDPEHDTPAKMREYAQRYKADPQRWKFLTGTRTELWKLSKDGFKFPVSENSLDSSNPITHSPRFLLVDAQSQVRGVYDSSQDDDVLQLVQDMQTLLSEPVANPPDAIVIGKPADIFDPVWLDGRQREQLSAANNIEAFHDFKFEDHRQQSGIDFIDRPVADVAKDFKQNHYDHANGVAAADVDGDGLIDLYFTCQRGENQLWKNLGDGKFKNITDSAGVGLKDRVSVAASFADTDNDGDADLFVTTTRHGNAFFLNDGNGNFEDKTPDSGLAYVGHSSGADFFDYDQDGLLDLLVTNVGKFTTDEIGFCDPANKESPYFIGTKTSFAGHLFVELSELSILYHNEGNNQFKDVTQDSGLFEDGWSGDATPLDANNDGWIDLYILNMQGNDVYYQNMEGHGFKNLSREMFPNPVWGGMGVKSFDYNNDGLLDLYVTNMHADMWQLEQGVLGVKAEKQRVPPTTMPQSYLRSRVAGNNVLGSALYVAQQSGGFKEIATEVNADNYWPWGPSAGDLNADGFQDLFVASCMNYPYRYHVNSLLLNDAGKTFQDAEFILGIEPRSTDVPAHPVFELECSGIDSKHPLCEGRTGTVSVWGAAGTRSAVIYDLDNDGDLDIVTNDFNSSPMVLISNLSERNANMHFLSIQLQGSKSNRDGLGAKIEVVLGDKVLTQVNDGQSGYLSQSSLPLYFGLGDSTSAEKVIVHWPSGTQQVVAGPIQANQTLQVIEE